MPKISVVLPCYNGEEYIAEAIQSILDQTYGDFELLVLDDGSTDNSAEIIKSFLDKRVYYIKNQENMGLIKTLNKGLDLAKGEYIARMDADDISKPTRFEKQVEVLNKNENIVMCGTWINFFNYPPRRGEGHHQKNVNYLSIMKGWCINHPTVMLRASTLKANNLYYCQNYKHAEDYELWSRLIKYGEIFNIEEELLDYRWHEGNISVVKEKEMHATSAKVKQNMLDFLTDDKSLQQQIVELVNKPRKETIPVFLSSDENYAPMVATTIISCMENTKSFVDFYILDAGITTESKDKIARSIKEYKDQCTIEFIEIDMSLFNEFADAEHYLNKASYVRLLIPQLKTNLDKVIYSDIDVIFTGDVREIYNENLESKIIGVIPDVYYLMNKGANDIYPRLDLPETHNYFYSGLIVINCEKWREENITAKLFAISKKFGDRIKQSDQDLLNIYFANNYKQLDVKYEVTNLYLKYQKKLSADIQKSINSPIIRHYESAFKPWNNRKFYNEKMKDFYLFWKYAKKTKFYKRLLYSFLSQQKKKNVIIYKINLFVRGLF